ncbi:MAG: DUF4198 domain-containing protein [Paludisphaera borealis]|uniref:DUF4198 domain-containing protein n=1 Tax=Paludisphaera borealis TaxID=1387353 RepID=UPI00284D1459|nr:DUF4198 domain-containing protein [Paludisphaera borealis]MDR3618525.1 DUF4198 domain-containing protein [Paludisphaera borealis]
MTKRLILLLAFATPASALAHDTWVQTNTNIVRAGDVVHVDLMLGNHGNEHRDFKLAGKLSLEGASLDVVGPDGTRYDLKDRLIDTGYTPQEGYWTTRFEPAQPGLYLVGHRSDRVMSYAPERSIKGAKTFFVAASSLDKPSADNPGFDKPLGHDLELVPVVNPVTPMGPGTPIQVRLLYKGRPLAGERVSFIPRGATLKSGLDDRYERLTDEKGEASFEPTEANSYLIAAHKTEPKQGGVLDGKPYQFTKYGATLTVFVPRICPCCGG